MLCDMDPLTLQLKRDVGGLSVHGPEVATREILT